MGGRLGGGARWTKHHRVKPSLPKWRDFNDQHADGGLQIGQLSNGKNSQPSSDIFCMKNRLVKNGILI